MKIKINYKRNISDGSCTSVIESIHLFTGDEKGIVRVWNLTPVLTLLETEYGLKPLKEPMRCDNPNRCLNYDASVELGEEEEENHKKRHTKESKMNEENENDGDSTFMTTTRTPSQKSNISDGPMPLISPMVRYVVVT